jgi:FtsP/CotA-like multicopper oxidase with cupredoxin domain
MRPLTRHGTSLLGGPAPADLPTLGQVPDVEMIARRHVRVPPHRHGLAADQVLSGLYGAIIIGEPDPSQPQVSADRCW